MQTDKAIFVPSLAVGYDGIGFYVNKYMHKVVGRCSISIASCDVVKKIGNDVAQDDDQKAGKKTTPPHDTDDKSNLILF